ncbi:hypothetical protein GCM10012287_29810 [Streptomyces daqingensis]|uniref:Uncharacterized protein n=1 Tax=Streptomyces daqingensis TaxID=1472640 RepID=A0ABQ2MDD2_9ACTN|nr:hypothetical protein GCM10012287_29810 [Streptomyces daqingensis]
MAGSAAHAHWLNLCASQPLPACRNFGVTHGLGAIEMAQWFSQSTSAPIGQSASAPTLRADPALYPPVTRTVADSPVPLARRSQSYAGGRSAGRCAAVRRSTGLTPA